MTVPTINAIINFSTGPAFAQAFLIDSGILGTNVLADAAAVIVDVSNQVNYVQTSSGRSPLVDQFQTGQLTLRIVDQNGDFNPTNVSSPYYGLLTPMKKVQITATYNGTTYPIFSGFITSYVNTQPKDATEVAYTTIQAVDAFRLANNVAGGYENTDQTPALVKAVASVPRSVVTAAISLPVMLDLNTAG